MQSQDTPQATRPGPAGMLEAIVKAGAVGLGLLYVCGLFVSNVHTMQLGISDFSGVQPRYVAVGMLFILYVALLLVVIVGTVYAFRVALRTKTVRARTLSLIAATFMGVSLLWTTGDIVGYLSSTGRKWTPGTDYSFEPRVTLGQLADAYRYPSILAACVSFAVIAAAALAVDRRQFKTPYVLSVTALVLSIAAMTMVFGYGANAYPNMRYNLGGGSPQVWEMLIDARLANRARVLGLTVTAVDSVTALAGPVAVWHRSEGYVYVTQLVRSGAVPLQVRALPSEDVKGIRVLLMSVRLNRDRTLSLVESY